MKKVLPTGMVVCEPTGELADLTIYDAQAQLSRHGHPTLLANFKRAGVPLPSGLSADDDLYQQAPDQVRREHSLHAIAPETCGQWLELVEELRIRHALAVVFAKCDFAELLKNLKIYLAWFAEPRVLDTQLRQGSEHLAEGILSKMEAVLLTPPGRGDWVAFWRSDANVDLAPMLPERK